MKKLINQVETVLHEQILGLVEAHPELTLHQDPVFVTRADAPVAGKVGILSGGGSGHEPMHCGFIGEGMLDGACQVRFSHRQRRIRCMNAAKPSTVAKAY